MPKKILIAEDDQALLNILATKIKSLDYIVIEARDGLQTINKFKKESPDLVLLDVVMPLKSGFEVLEVLKIKQKTKVPIIILSNLAEPHDLETAKKLGAFDYITKSDLTLKELMFKINKALERNK